MKKARKLAAFAAALAAVLALAGCGGEPAEETKAETVAATAAATDPMAETMEVVESTEEPGATIAGDGTEFAPEESAGIAVTTPYITLYYPEEWQGVVEASQQDDEGIHTVTFRTNIADTDVELFTLIFGASEIAEGFPLGKLEDETAGTVYVFAAMNETMPESWSDEDAARFGTMQERVNDLIMQLHEDERFDSGK